MIEQIEIKRRNVQSSFLHLMTNIHRKQRFAFYSVESTIDKKTNKIEKASGVRKKSELRTKCMEWKNEYGRVKK